MDAEFKSERQELKQIESRLTERATSLDRKDDNLTSKEQTLEQKEQSISDRAKNLDAREEQLEEVERQKEAELERIGALSQAEARDIILAQTEENLTRRLPVAFAKLSKRSRNVLTKWPRTSWFKLCNVSLVNM